MLVYQKNRSLSESQGNLVSEYQEDDNIREEWQRWDFLINSKKEKKIKMQEWQQYTHPQDRQDRFQMETIRCRENILLYIMPRNRKCSAYAVVEC